MWMGIRRLENTCYWKWSLLFARIVNFVCFAKTMDMVWWMKSPPTKMTHIRQRSRALRNYTFYHNLVHTVRFTTRTVSDCVHFFCAVSHFGCCTSPIFDDALIFFFFEWIICGAFYSMQHKWRIECSTSTSIVGLFSTFLHFACDALTMFQYLTPSYLPFILTFCWSCAATLMAIGAMQTIRLVTSFWIDARPTSKIKWIHFYVKIS